MTLIDAGMNTARFNFSHGDHEAHGACLKRVREAAALRPEKNIGILLDTKGPEIRTGFFKEECKSKIHLKKGGTVELTTDYSFKGDETKFACTYSSLPTSVRSRAPAAAPDHTCSVSERAPPRAPGSARGRWLAPAAHRPNPRLRTAWQWPLAVASLSFSPSPLSLAVSSGRGSPGSRCSSRADGYLRAFAQCAGLRRPTRVWSLGAGPGPSQLS